jgi:uncharacterized protein (TIGR00369 family)
MGKTALESMPMPPSAILLGWKLVKYDATKGWARIAFEGKPEFVNPAGFIQGGFLAAMLDDSMGPAVWFKTDGALYTATIDMNVSFLAPAKPGALFGEGSVVQLGKTIAFLEGRLMDADGQILARATSTARLLVADRALVAPP